MSRGVREVGCSGAVMVSCAGRAERAAGTGEICLELWRLACDGLCAVCKAICRNPVCATPCVVSAEIGGYAARVSEEPRRVG